LRGWVLKSTLLAFVLMLTGCTSSWQAPLETRSGGKRIGEPMPRAYESANVMPNSDTYQVQRGDTLYAISWRTNTDFKELADWNEIDSPYVIYSGQELRLTPPTKVAKTQAIQRSSKTRSSTPTRVKPKPRKAVELDKVSVGNPRWLWPSKGRVISTFNARDPQRKGLKISGKEGSDVVATEAGRVVYSGSGLVGYGRLIIIKHNENYLSAYGHNKALLVEQGQAITKGQTIAQMGRINDAQAGLHFEIRRNGKPVDPMKLLPR
jgi:lipoprotein NlpD